MVRDISGSIYRALQSVMTCGCPSAHNVGLRLTPPLRAIGPEDEDDDVAKKLEFGLAISHQPSSSQRRWREMIMKIMEDSTIAIAAERPHRSVRFAMTTDASAAEATSSLAIQSAFTSLALTEINLRESHIENLCEIMQQLEEDRKDCGCLKDSQSPRRREFRVCALKSPSSDWALMSIKDILLT